MVETSIAFLNMADVRDTGVMAVGEAPHHFTSSVESFLVSLKTKVTSALRNPCFFCRFLFRFVITAPNPTWVTDANVFKTQLARLSFYKCYFVLFILTFPVSPGRP